MRNESKVGWWILLMNLAVSAAVAQDLFESSQSGDHKDNERNVFTLGGFIRSSVYIGKSPEEKNPYIQSAASQVGLQLHAKSGAWANGKVDIRFNHGSEFRQSISAIDIREAYVDFTSGPVGVKIGKLISPWGKATAFNPTDMVTPLDPTVRSPDKDDIYLGTWALEGQLVLGTSMKVTCTWKPLFNSSVLLIDPIPQPDYVNFLEVKNPGLELKEGSYGIKFDLHSRPIDVSVYWFEGYQPWPGIGIHSFEIDSSTLEPIALNLQEYPFRIYMAGIDFSIPMGPVIIRAEGAFQHTILNTEEFEYLPLPDLSYTAEAEWSDLQNTLIAGYYGKYIFDYIPSVACPSLSVNQDQLFLLIQQGYPPTPETIDGAIREQLKAFNRLYTYQLEKNYHSVFFIWKGSYWHEKVELTVPLIYYITTGEWVLQPMITYAPTDGARITLGLNNLRGPDKSLYHLVGPVLNAGFLSMKLTF